MNEWLKIMITSIVTFVLGAVVAVFAEPFRRWLFSSRLIVSFEPKAGAASKHIAITPAETSSGQVIMQKYIRAAARNVSWATAKECKVYLTSIEREIEPGHFKLLHHDPLPLPWALLGPDGIDIPRGMQFFFDIVMVQDGSNLLLPQAKPAVVAWATTLRDAARYRFTVVAAGDNIAPVERSVIFNWKGSFDSATEDCFS